MLKKQYLKTKPFCKVTFVLPKEAAAEAKEVRLLGDFNDWNWENGIVMKPTKSEFKATLELETGRTYEFRYLIDGATWVNDWDADNYVPSPFHGIDNSVVRIEAQQPAAPAKKKAVLPKKKAAKVPAKKKAAKPKKTAAKAPAKKSRQEDLKKIEGIGPKIEKLLKAKGIHTFADLAGAKKSAVKEILADAGPRYRMHDPSTWMKQAKLAADGEWEKMQKLQDKLKGGKKK